MNILNFSFIDAIMGLLDFVYSGLLFGGVLGLLLFFIKAHEGRR